MSVFAASDDPRYLAGEAGGASSEYVALILEERQLMSKLVELSNATFKLLLTPIPNDYKAHGVRYATLLKWLEAHLDSPQIDFRCTECVGPNRLMLLPDLCIESRFHPTHGYSDNVISYGHDRITQTVRDFEHLFQLAGSMTPT